MKRKLFIYRCYFLFWLNKCWIYLKQILRPAFYTTIQENREQNRMIKQTTHYNKHIVKPGDRYKSVVLGGRRY